MELSNGGNKESIGIESINIKYNSWYFPEINIKFVDVRGNSVFNPMEMTNDINRSEAKGSFFNCLFQFPYPIFKLTVKGYYGKDWMYVSTWKKASVKGFAKRIKEKFTKVATKYELISWQPVVRDGFGRFSNYCLGIINKEFSECSTVQEARKLLRKYANYCHPDKGYNTYVDNKNWEFVLHTYECVVKLIDVLQSAWDDDDFSWD